MCLDWTSNPLVCRPVLKPLSHTSQGGTIASILQVQYLGYYMLPHWILRRVYKLSGYLFFFVLISLISYENRLALRWVSSPVLSDCKVAPSAAFSANAGFLSSKEISIYTMTKLQVKEESVHWLPLLLSSLPSLRGSLDAPFLYFSGTSPFNPHVLSSQEILGGE